MILPTSCHKRSCRHYRGVTAGPEMTGEADARPVQRPYCAAYPQGIPTEIVTGQDLHEQPRGDERDGLTYERGEMTPYAPIFGVEDE